MQLVRAGRARAAPSLHGGLGSRSHREVPSGSLCGDLTAPELRRVQPGAIPSPSHQREPCWNSAWPVVPCRPPRRLRSIPGRGRMRRPVGLLQLFSGLRGTRRPTLGSGSQRSRRTRKSPPPRPGPTSRCCDLRRAISPRPARIAIATLPRGSPPERLVALPSPAPALGWDASLARIGQPVSRSMPAARQTHRSQLRSRTTYEHPDRRSVPYRSPCPPPGRTSSPGSPAHGHSKSRGSSGRLAPGLASRPFRIDVSRASPLALGPAATDPSRTCGDLRSSPHPRCSSRLWRRSPVAGRSPASVPPSPQTDPEPASPPYPACPSGDLRHC